MDRRSILKGAAVSIVLPAASVSATSPHPDAALLAAWAAYVDGHCMVDGLPVNLTDEEREPYWAPIDAAADTIEATAAVTPAGFAVKMRYLFLKLAGSAESERFILFGGQPPAELEENELGLLWTMIRQAERVGGDSAIRAFMEIRLKSS